jgi:hypothetical protein
MKIVIPLALLILALGAACGSPHAATAPVAAATAIPTGPTAREASTAMSAGTPAPEEAASPIDLEFSGKVVGRMTHVQVEGTLCAAPRHIISAILTGDVGGEPVRLQIIVNYPAGESQALVVMAPPLTGPVPTPGPYGDDPRSLSSYAGRVAIAPDGRSVTMAADLAHGGLPVVERVTGRWSC